MSFDISLEIDTGNKHPATVEDVANITYNVAPMYFDAAQNDRGIRGFHGVLAKNAIPLLSEMVKRMKDNPEKYRAMNPPNGWGDYEGALRVLELLLVACEKHPKTTISIT